MPPRAPVLAVKNGISGSVSRIREGRISGDPHSQETRVR